MVFQIPNTIQPKENSTGGGMEDILYIGSVWRNWNGDRNVPYLNRNGDRRNLNLNYFSNRWNEDCRFAAVRKSLYSPALCRSFFLYLFFPAPEHFSDGIQ